MLLGESMPGVKIVIKLPHNRQLSSLAEMKKCLHVCEGIMVCWL